MTSQEDTDRYRLQQAQKLIDQAKLKENTMTNNGRIDPANFDPANFNIRQYKKAHPDAWQADIKAVAEARGYKEGDPSNWVFEDVANEAMGHIGYYVVRELRRLRRLGKPADLNAADEYIGRNWAPLIVDDAEKQRERERAQWEQAHKKSFAEVDMGRKVRARAIDATTPCTVCGEALGHEPHVVAEKLEVGERPEKPRRMTLAELEAGKKLDAASAPRSIRALAYSVAEIIGALADAVGVDVEIDDEGFIPDILIKAMQKKHPDASKERIEKAIVAWQNQEPAAA